MFMNYELNSLKTYITYWKWEYVELGKSTHLGWVDLNEHSYLVVVRVSMNDH